MALTTQRKATVGVLALALAALAVDRFLLSGGGPASVSAQTETAGVEAQAVGNARAAGPILTSGISLAERIGAVAATGVVHGDAPDVFSDPAQESASADMKAIGWRLTSILVSGGRQAVVVDGTPVPLGGVYGGRTLVRVEQNAAIFERDGKEFRLELDVPGVKRAAPDNRG